MKRKYLTALAGLLLFVAACNNNQHTTITEKKDTASVKTAVAAEPHYTAEMVDNKKDPSCGMPVKAGIEDTLHYKGKILGFCSKECKDAFLKNPEQGIAAADLKKK